MDFRIVEEKENKVLERKEINFEVIDAKITPTRKEIQKRIAALKNSKEELVSVVRVKQEYGKHRVIGLAHVYSNEKSLRKTEPAYIQKREKKKEENKGTGNETKKEENAKPEANEAETVKEEKTGQEPRVEKKE